MTTITIDRRLLEQALAAIQELEYADTAVSDKKARDAKQSIRAALAAPATAPEPVAWMSPKRFYRTRAMALTNGEQLIEPLYRNPPAQPAWHDAPTAPGTWILSLDSGMEVQENITQHEIDIEATWPGGRWYGPIPEDRQ